MESLTLIPIERLDTFQADLQEIKSLLQEQSKQSDFNRWLPKKEARIRLNVCQKTFDNYLSKGIIPHSRFAGKIYIKASDIEAHLERHYIRA
jgi:phosphoserine aminotransferase